MNSPSKIGRQRRQQAWLKWIDHNRNTLQSIGLSPEVYLDIEHWEDFLQNGYVEWHPESYTGFDFTQLSRDRMRRFLDYLEANDDFHPDYCPMIRWLRVRLGIDAEP